MDKEKKKWEAPKLICLYRGRPEETVLQFCKSAIVAGSGHPNKCTEARACKTQIET